MQRITEVVKNLIGINVIMFILFTWLMPKIGDQLILYYFSSPNFKPWQPLTSMFMHASINHIFFNMLGLFFFGIILEQVWGSAKFLRFYLYSGIGAFLFQWAFWYWQYQGTPELNQVAMLGASGAVMGVLGGVAMLAPDMRVQLLFPPVELKMKYLVLIYFLIDLYSGLANQGGIANFAHIGGLFTGLLIAFIWKSRGHLHS